MKNDKTSSNFAVAKNGGTFPANIIHCHFDSIACHKLVFASHWVFASLQFEDVIWTTPTEVLGVLPVAIAETDCRLRGPVFCHGHEMYHPVMDLFMLKAW